MMVEFSEFSFCLSEGPEELLNWVAPKIVYGVVKAVRVHWIRVVDINHAPSVIVVEEEEFSLKEG